ncbi:MAG: hypothetical protein L3J51_09325 [Cocleimonas sp.]|nr:hypothetical protein [Cocleimonas sp.]
MNQLEHKFFGEKVYARFGNSESNSIPISVVDLETSEAWHKVFNYDSTVEILESDKDKLEELVGYYQKKNQKTSNLFLSLLNFIVEVAGVIESIIQTVLGSFFGFGLVGIFIVIGLIFMSYMVSLYVIILLAPIFIISFILKMRIQKKTNLEVVNLQNAILAEINSNQKQ